MHNMYRLNSKLCVWMCFLPHIRRLLLFYVLCVCVFCTLHSVLFSFIFTVLITSNACVARMPRVRTCVYTRVGVNCYLLQTPCFSFFLVNHASPTERICPRKGWFVCSSNDRMHHMIWVGGWVGICIPLSRVLVRHFVLAKQNKYFKFKKLVGRQRP